ncbi:MAG: hypothetical protein KKF48_00755 [Nanoarchaeota archaeon]|nr:hypothetical protein [Nanoarchaeota archaeon]MBU1027553.1 hypothetical protein [Nanoarchaeota archaeon]
MCVEDVFKREIYKYCDKNIGKRSFFTAFRILWPLPFRDNLDDKSYQKSEKDILNLTSKVLGDLQKKKILKEIYRPKKFEEVGFFPIWPMYEILPHKTLIKERFK